MMNNRFAAASSAGLVVLGLLAAALPSCRLYNLERKLDAVSAEFLSDVRYIITSEERKIFLELPESEREKFKEEFWQRRDPDPSTEENEFKDEYFNRVEKANELFVGEGRKGWLTDRGRIYVLFGPPMDRIRNPMGQESYSRCSEVWYYADFPVVFVDTYCSGEYRLVTYDLTALRDFNLAYMHELNRAQSRASGTFRSEKTLFDFNWSLRRVSAAPGRVEAVVVVEIPYDVIWFKSVADRMETTLEVELSLRDAEKNPVWEHKDSLLVSLAEEELKGKKNARHRWEIPLVLDHDLDRVGGGKGKLHIRLVNKTGNEELRKVMDFSI